MDPRPSDPAPVSGARSGSGHGRLPLVLAVAAGVLLLDLVTKVVVVARLEGREPIELFGGLLTLRVVRNPGAAFSFATGFTVVFTVVAVVVAIVVVRLARRLRSTAWAITLGALLGGALGNLVCRLLRAPGPFEGHVVDWIELPRYPLFNVADAAISLAAVGIVVLTVRGVPFEGRVGAGRPSVTDTGAMDTGATGADPTDNGAGPDADGTAR